MRVILALVNVECGPCQHKDLQLRFYHASAVPANPKICNCATAMQVRLIADKSSVGYSRCGRTDKGVSALGQASEVHKSSFHIVVHYSYRSALDESLKQLVNAVWRYGHDLGD